MNLLSKAFAICCVLSACMLCNAFQLKNNERKFALLSEDHGILSDVDFSDERVAKEPYRKALKQFDDYIYWQCFSRDAITVSLKELGYSSEDIGWVDNYSSLTFTGIDKNNIIHKYRMRRIWPIQAYLKKFNVWLNLMNKEKHVCIAGSLPFSDKKSNKSEKKQNCLLDI